MPKNNELLMVANPGPLGGFANLYKNENIRWWRTRRWLVQIIVWGLIVNGILAMVLFVAPKVAAQKQAAASQQAQEMTGEVEALPTEGLDLSALTVFLSLAGMAPAIGVAILGVEAMISEKTHGTAAWILSKPVSRSAFVLAKVVANSLGILVTMVIFQGALAYLQVYIATSTAFPLLPYTGALGMVFLSLLFFLTLTIMLGALSNSRGLTIGIPLLFILGYQLFAMLGDWITEIMPWNLTASLSAGKPALGLVLIAGQPLPTVTPLIATAVWCAIFTAVALWRFSREEF